MPRRLKEAKKDARRQKDVIFQLMQRFPLLSVDFVTAVVLSTDGDYAASVKLLDKEHEEMIVRQSLSDYRKEMEKKENEDERSLKNIQGLFLEQEIKEQLNEELKYAKEDKDDNNSDVSNAKEEENKKEIGEEQKIEEKEGDEEEEDFSKYIEAEEAKKESDSKYERLEAVVRTMAESFPHIPLDDVWTAVIQKKGDAVEVSNVLMEYAEPVSPVLLPLADRAELEENVVEEQQPRIEPCPLAESQVKLRTSADEPAVGAIVADVAALQVEAQESADAQLARLLQNEEEQAANEAIWRTMKDEQLRGFRTVEKKPKFKPDAKWREKTQAQLDALK